LELADDLEYVPIFVIKDAVALTLLVIGLKVGELIMALAFIKLRSPFHVA
jgi:hypothetical protein